MSIGNIREVLARLEDIMAAECVRYARSYGDQSIYFEDSRTLYQIGRRVEKKALKLVKQNGSKKVRR